MPYDGEFAQYKPIHRITENEEAKSRRFQAITGFAHVQPMKQPINRA